MQGRLCAFRSKQLIGFLPRKYSFMPKSTHPRARISGLFRPAVSLFLSSSAHKTLSLKKDHRFEQTANQWSFLFFAQISTYFMQQLLNQCFFISIHCPIKPLCPCIAPEPCPLPFGIASGALLDQVNRFRQRTFPS